MWFRGRKSTLRDQQDAVERVRNREAQADARRQLRDGDERIDRLRQQTSQAASVND